MTPNKESWPASIAQGAGLALFIVVVSILLTNEAARTLVAHLLAGGK